MKFFADLFKKKNSEENKNEDDEPNFIKKDKTQEQEEEEAHEEAQEIIDNLKETYEIIPESNQQRNLDREVGGVEEGKSALKEEKSSEKHVEDAWDDRSEEVDKMGSHNPLAGSAKQSMIWILKKRKLDEKKKGKAVGALAAGKQMQKSDKDVNSSKSQGGFATQLNNFRTARVDHSHEPGGKGGGRGR